MADFEKRLLLKLMAAGAVTYPMFRNGVFAMSSVPKLASENDIWHKSEEIRSRISPPKFPKKDFDIRKFGAIADGKTDCTEAFKKAVTACSDAGGGRIVVEGGVYKTGPIHLLSNINLYIAKGATISFIPEPKRYLPAVFTRWEGMELMGYSPLVYAYEQENVAVTGEGVLDGNGDPSTWWHWKGPWKHHKEWGADGAPTQKTARAKLFEDAENGVPPEERLYAEGAYLRPPFVQPYKCKNVLIEGVTITNSPFWLLHPVLCENVTIRGVTCQSKGPNSDGCDPESCKDVLIEKCYFDTGDDCIAMKSGRNADGRRINRPIENVVIADCKMRAGHGGVVIGSEISGGARNIFVENCEMSSPDLDRGIRIKTNSHRGGLIEDYFIRNIQIGNVKDAIVINFYYEEGDSGKFDPIVRNIQIENMTVEHAERAFQVRGFERAPIYDLKLADVTFTKVDKDSVIENVKGFVTDKVTINGKPFSYS